MAVFRMVSADDLALSNGDFVWIDGLEQVRQNIAARFKFFYGEWFLDTRQGVPYFQNILTKSPDLDLVRSTLRGVLLASKEVISIERFSVEYDQRARRLSFSFSCKTTEGDLIVLPSDRAFIVEIFA